MSILGPYRQLKIDRGYFYDICQCCTVHFTTACLLIFAGCALSSENCTIVDDKANKYTPSELERFIFSHDPYIVHSNDSAIISVGYYQSLDSIADKLVDFNNDNDLVSVATMALNMIKQEMGFEYIGNKELIRTDMKLKVSSLHELFEMTSSYWVISNKRGYCFPLSVIMMLIFERLNITSALVKIADHVILKASKLKSEAIYVDASVGELVKKTDDYINRHFCGNRFDRIDIIEMDKVDLESFSYSHLGSMFYIIGQYEKAILYTRKAINERHSNTSAVLNLLYIYFSRGHYLEIINYIEGDNRDILANAYGLYYYGLSKINIKSIDEGLKYIEGAHSLDNSNTEILETVMLLLAKKGKTDEAKELRNKLISLVSEGDYLVVRLRIRENSGKIDFEDKDIINQIKLDHIITMSDRNRKYLKDYLTKKGYVEKLDQLMID